MMLPARAEDSESTSAARQCRITCLLIDDEQAIHTSLRKVLQHPPPVPVDLICASSLSAGMETARAICPDVILLDLHFSGELCQSGQDLKSGCGAVHCIWPLSMIAPVIIFSGLDTVGMWDVCAMQGSLDFLAKEIFIDPAESVRAELLRCMWNAIRVHRALKYSGHYELGRTTPPKSIAS